MTVELIGKKYKGNSYFYAELELPATKYQIENALLKARFSDAVFPLK